jgi:hypothetical protein
MHRFESNVQINNVLSQQKPTKPKTAGINDLLLGGKPANDIWYGGLKALYDEALSKGAHVIAIAPLPTALTRGCVVFFFLFGCVDGDGLIVRLPSSVWRR